MALTQSEINKCIRNLKQQSKTLLYGSGLSKYQVIDALTALDDDYEARRSTLKGLVDTAAGETLAGNVAKAIGKAWLTMKWGGE